MRRHVKFVSGTNQAQQLTHYGYCATQFECLHPALWQPQRICCSHPNVAAYVGIVATPAGASFGELSFAPMPRFTYHSCGVFVWGDRDQGGYTRRRYLHQVTFVSLLGSSLLGDRAEAGAM